MELEQVLVNLVMNAVQASPAGAAVRLRVGVEVHALGGGAPEACARVDVIDRGHGVRPEERARLFEPFFSTKPAGEGTGLGLSIVEDIVRDHGGVVEVASAPGEGATFTVVLPAEHEDAGLSSS